MLTYLESNAFHCAWSFNICCCAMKNTTTGNHSAMNRNKTAERLLKAVLPRIMYTRAFLISLRYHGNNELKEIGMAAAKGVSRKIRPRGCKGGKRHKQKQEAKREKLLSQTVEPPQQIEILQTRPPGTKPVYTGKPGADLDNLINIKFVPYYQMKKYYKMNDGETERSVSEQGRSRSRSRSSDEEKENKDVGDRVLEDFMRMKIE